MAHTLIHWRFHLNEWVVNYLENKGILDDEEILQRSRWSQRQKERYATETLGMMLETGEIQKLWRDFHINLRTARESQVSLPTFYIFPDLEIRALTLHPAESRMNFVSPFGTLRIGCSFRGNWI